MDIERIKKSIRNIPDFPKPGIQFKDITTLLQNNNAFGETIDYFYKTFKNKNIDVILDDTDENFSSKIKKFNLIGAPYQIILGKKSDGLKIEFLEIGKEPQYLTLEQITKILIEQKEKLCTLEILTL